ncbi:hypothetical protein [Kribbella sp. NPDC004875]|uniref:hypothetical protein n=1 Tax=Kribbella sp. NPDC004875 TaxID=3364107 RepID=UPI0036791233
MQENTSTTSTGELVNVPLTGADKVAYAFYATAAAAALVGQVWAGVTHIPWPDSGFSTLLKIVLVTPAVAVLELGGVATAALADLRRRKGEQAYAYRAMSFFAALVAVVFNVVGHWRPEERFLAFGFGGLSAFAYVLWLIHSSARRRDALRKAGQMRDTGPVYGIVQWAREPRVTWLARSLAIEHGYTLYESLRAAHHQIRNRSRREAIAGTVAEYIRSEHQDERLAKIAETTYDPDRLAGMLEERINYEVITNKLTKAISPPPEQPEARPAAVWVLEGGQPRRADGTGVGLRGDEDAWTGELMAIVDQPDPTDSGNVSEAVVVEDESEPQHVVNGTSSSLKPFAPQPKAEPLVEKPKPPSPFAGPADPQPPALITTPKVEPVLPGPEPVAAEPAATDDEPSPLEVKRQRAWALLADWSPERGEITAKKIADAIACSEPMASRYIEQYQAEHGVVLVAQN